MGDFAMIYACDHCRFIFNRAGKVDACPDCGKQFIREATKAENDEYMKNQAALGKEVKQP